MNKLALLFSALGLVAASPCSHTAIAQTYTVLHDFEGPDGQFPEGGVTIGPDGTLYGTTDVGGGSTGFEEGTVFDSDTFGNIMTLHTFDGTDGIQPGTAPLTLFGGTLYGSTQLGGSDSCGILYSLKTDGSDYTVLYNFQNTTGCQPNGALQPDSGYGLVGVTTFGGPAFNTGNYGGVPSGQGVLFVLTPAGHYHLLHQFGAAGDGIAPNFVVVDKAGNVFGSTNGGGFTGVEGTKGCGTIFKLDPSTHQYSIIYSFGGGLDGCNPILGSIGSDGTLYGVARDGKGLARRGALFALKPSAGKYTLDILNYFGVALGDPQTGPTLTARGQLIGVSGEGLYAYDLGSEKQHVLQYMRTDATGKGPYAQPAVASDGSIFGTTNFGGEPPCTYKYGCGVLYRYSPN